MYAKQRKYLLIDNLRELRINCTTRSSPMSSITWFYAPHIKHSSSHESKNHTWKLLGARNQDLAIETNEIHVQKYQLLEIRHENSDTLTSILVIKVN